MRNLIVLLLLFGLVGCSSNPLPHVRTPTVIGGETEVAVFDWDNIHWARRLAEEHCARFGRRASYLGSSGDPAVAPISRNPLYYERPEAHFSCDE